MDKFIINIKDSRGIIWVYEGTLDGIPMWTPETNAMPAQITEDQIINVFKTGLVPGGDEEIIIKRA